MGSGARAESVVAQPKEQGMTAGAVSVVQPGAKPGWRGRVRQALAWGSLLGSLLVATTCLVWGPGVLSAPLARPAAATAAQPGAKPQPPDVAVAADVQPASSLRRIESIRLGERVLGHNPQRRADQAAEPEVDSATWRQINLELRKANGRLLYMGLLRSQS